MEAIELEAMETGEIVKLPCQRWIGNVAEHGDAFVDLALDKQPFLAESRAAVTETASIQPSKPFCVTFRRPFPF